MTSELRLDLDLAGGAWQRPGQAVMAQGDLVDVTLPLPATCKAHD